MAAYDFVTPGSAVADTVQQILQRNRDMQRQAMLDRLQGEQLKDAFLTNQARRDQITNEQSLNERKFLEDQKTGELSRKSLQEQILENQLKTIQEGAQLGDLPQELQDVARSRGYSKMQTPKVTTGQTYQGVDQAPVTDTSVGQGTEVFMTPEQRMKERAQQDIENYIASNPDLANTNPDLLRVLSMNAQGVNAPLPQSLLEPPPSLQTITPGGAPGNVIRGTRGTQFSQLTHPPSAYQPTLMPTTSIDDNGNLIILQNRGFDPKNPESAVLRIPGFSQFNKVGGGVSRTGNRATDMIAKDGWAGWNATLKRGSNESNADFERRRRGGPGILAARFNAQATTPNVRSVVMETIKTMQRRIDSGQPIPTPENIMLNAQRMVPNLTPDEIADIQQFAIAVNNPAMFEGN